MLASIKLAKYLDLSRDDTIVTVATDGAELYDSEREKARANYLSPGFDAVAASETFGRYVLGAATDHLIELSHRDRNRIFNLGYFTWVEQQGISPELFDARRDLKFWRDLHDLIPVWDDLIDTFNGRTGVATSP